MNDDLITTFIIQDYGETLFKIDLYDDRINVKYQIGGYDSNSKFFKHDVIHTLMFDNHNDDQVKEFLESHINRSLAHDYGPADALFFDSYDEDREPKSRVHTFKNVCDIISEVKNDSSCEDIVSKSNKELIVSWEMEILTNNFFIIDFHSDRLIIRYSIYAYNADKGNMQIMEKTRTLELVGMSMNHIRTFIESQFEQSAIHELERFDIDKARFVSRIKDGTTMNRTSSIEQILQVISSKKIAAPTKVDEVKVDKSSKAVEEVKRRLKVDLDKVYTDIKELEEISIFKVDKLLQENDSLVNRNQRLMEENTQLREEMDNVNSFYQSNQEEIERLISDVNEYENILEIYKELVASYDQAFDLGNRIHRNNSSCIKYYGVLDESMYDKSMDKIEALKAKLKCYTTEME